MAKNENEQYSTDQIEKRMDRALRRSMKMPPPSKSQKAASAPTAKRATSKKRAPSA